MWQLRRIATWGRPDVEAAALGFNYMYEAYTKCKVRHLSVHDLLLFTADDLRYAVTLTFDALTLNVCSVSAVMWSNSVPHTSEIEQSAAEL